MTRRSEAVAGRYRGVAGGTARAAKLTPEQRSEISRKAARALWGDHVVPPPPPRKHKKHEAKLVARLRVVHEDDLYSEEETLP